MVAVDGELRIARTCHLGKDGADDRLDGLHPLFAGRVGFAGPHLDRSEAADTFEFALLAVLELIQRPRDLHDCDAVLLESPVLVLEHGEVDAVDLATHRIINGPPQADAERWAVEPVGDGDRRAGDELPTLLPQ